MSQISVLRGAEPAGWTPLLDPPGRIPSPGREIQAFASGDGTFTCGLWEREPDTWSFERPYDEVAYVIRGSAEIETDDGRALLVRAGDVLVTPIGSKGTWRILEPLVKFYAIYTGGTVGDTAVRTIGADDPVEWVVLENPPGDPNPPGREWYAWRSADARFSAGVWEREPETGAFRRGYHEVACLIEGDVEIETDEGVALRAGRADVLVTPEGSAGVWRALTHVKKFWAVHHE